MKYSEIGQSGLRVSEISFGCMSLGTDHELSNRMLYKALEQGINLFDTADLYEKGQNEMLVGRAFLGIRQQVVLATKVGNEWRKDGKGWDWNPTKKYILRAVEQSLKRLQTDYIDLYQLHGGAMEDPIDETIEAFEVLKEEGKIRAYGISSIRPSVIREYVKRSNIASVMMQYSLLDRRPEESCLNLLQENKIRVLARGSLAKGLLINKPAVPFLNYTESEVTKAAQTIQRVADDNRTPTAVAIRYALHHPVVASAVVGLRTEDQLAAAIEAGKSFPLDQKEIQQLQAAIPSNTYQEHR